MSDEMLVTRYVETNNKEFVAELFERYTHLVYGICLNYLHNEDQCKDTVMEIFESLFQKLSIHTINNFRNWLYTVSKNYCLMQFRKNGAFNKLIYRLQDESDHFVLPETPHEQESVNELRLLNAAVSQLRKEQEVCIRLMYLERKSYRDITDITGFSMNEVKSHIQNGKRNLKNILTNLTNDQTEEKNI